MILEGIEDITGVKTWADLKKWMQDSGTKLEAFTGTDGFDTINGRNFMSGESGRIWKLKGMDLVLKLTTDPEEIELAKKIETQQLPSFLTIYKSINLKGIGRDGEKVPAQIRIQALYQPIDIPENKVFDKTQLFKWIQDNNLKLDDIKHLKLSDKDKELLVKVIKFGIQLRKDLEILNLDIDDIDFHDNNVMQSKDGSWKMIDF